MLILFFDTSELYAMVQHFLEEHCPSPAWHRRIVTIVHNVLIYSCNEDRYYGERQLEEYLLALEIDHLQAILGSRRIFDEAGRLLAPSRREDFHRHATLNDYSVQITLTPVVWDHYQERSPQYPNPDEEIRYEEAYSDDCPSIPSPSRPLFKPSL